MAGEKSIGKAIGYFIFYVLGWRRFVAGLAALASGWAVAAAAVVIALAAFPKPDFPTSEGILADQYLAPERWNSPDPDYVARRQAAEAEHATEVELYDAASASRELAINISAGLGVVAGLGVAALAYRLLRRRWLADPLGAPA